VVAAAVAFVAGHFVLSHSLRGLVVRALGPVGFQALYSIVALASVVWLGAAYRAAPTTEPLWRVGEGVWGLVTLVMLLASILMMGSLVRNPATIGYKPQSGQVPAPRGVYAVTRHPMMWAFALWGLCHILVFPVAKNLVVCAAIVVLALIGAALQDEKKAREQPDFWPKWRAGTSYWPFAAVASGRARIGSLGTHAIAGEIVVWLAATWAHIPLSGYPAGVWRWL
jgi:uncharacterized membrane protein